MHLIKQADIVKEGGMLLVILDREEVPIGLAED